MKKASSIFFIILALVGLVCVRIFENFLFNDPLLSYFKSNFQTYELPDFKSLSYMVSIIFRYSLNLALSLVIIWFLYNKREFIKAALWVYLFAFIILSVAFLILSNLDYEWVKMGLFYTRRFLIHPILLFILVPGFYFISKTKINQ